MKFTRKIETKVNTEVMGWDEVPTKHKTNILDATSQIAEAVLGRKVICKGIDKSSGKEFYYIPASTLNQMMDALAS
jgi:hypothetical protein